MAAVARAAAVSAANSDPARETDALTFGKRREKKQKQFISYKIYRIKQSNLTLNEIYGHISGTTEQELDEILLLGNNKPSIGATAIQTLQ